MTKQAPTVEAKSALEVEDGGRRAFDITLTARQIHDLYQGHIIYVIDEEQRGTDPVSNKEILNNKKVEDWVQRELEGELHMGQVTLCAHTELGTTYEFDGSLKLYGGLAIADGRQRVYTAAEATDKALQGLAPEYDPDRKISVRVYVDLDSEQRKELFTQMNGGRGGDHADQGRVEWMSPEGVGVVAKKLVTTNPHLGTENVNVVKNKVTRKDHRLAGFNTFVNAIGSAWNKPLTQAESEKLAAFLNDYWNKLVTVLPDLKVLPLAERLVVRDRSLVGNPLAIYGFMAVAKRLSNLDQENPPLERLEQIDPTWFDIDNQDWRDIGVMAPSFDLKTHEIKYYRVRNAFQTRKAFADYLVSKMFAEDEIAA